MNSELTIEEVESHFLYPSNIFISNKQVRVNTILGSCVSVCLYDSYTKYGGINHYMIPLWNGVGLASPKYGNIAIDLLVEQMLLKGSKKKDLIAKIFGGASQFDYQNDVLAVGERNIQIARAALEAHSIRITASNVGGIQGRKIHFDTGTGQVIMKLIVKQNPA
jgi:chemotaxis protein CheD